MKGSIMKSKLHFRYIYSFYSFDELMDTQAIDETVEIDTGTRFKLHLQEDSTFLISSVGKDAKGRFAILTFPNKDNLVIYEAEESEIAYDEFFDSMGDNNHNVYEGTVTLI